MAQSLSILEGAAERFRPTRWCSIAPGWPWPAPKTCGALTALGKTLDLKTNGPTIHSIFKRIAALAETLHLPGHRRCGIVGAGTRADSALHAGRRGNEAPTGAHGRLAERLARLAHALEQLAAGVTGRFDDEPRRQKA